LFFIFLQTTEFTKENMRMTLTLPNNRWSVIMDRLFDNIDLSYYG